MPDVWTHLICGWEVLKYVDKPFKKIARRDIKLYNFGLQGPDFFYYYNFLPWTGNKRAFAIGNMIHNEKCGLFFRKSLEYLKDNPDDRTIVYLMALMCHWCLDRVTHPFINFISGIPRGEGPGNEKLVNNHKRVEAAIDAILVKRFLNMDVRKVPVSTEFNIGPNLPGEVINLYKTVLPVVFGNEYRDYAGEELFQKSYRDMIKAHGVLYDPRGIKRFAASVYDVFSARVENTRHYFYRAPEKNTEPYMNEKKREWCHPMDPGECYSESFPELFQKGVEESVRTVNISMKYILEGADGEELEEVTQDISHSTGKACTDSREMVCFNPVLIKGR
ncbi:MAG: zinc dependent phospholipase C family protein [Bacillota bacterium]